MLTGDRTILITGAGRGIGAALAMRFAEESPRGIVVSDIDLAAARAVAGQLPKNVPTLAHRADVTDPDDVDELVRVTEREFGCPDLVCSNAGVATGAGLFATTTQWERSFGVNVLGHVLLARAVLPGMLSRGTGYLVITASAVGLLGLPADAPYSVTKHATVGLAEWLAFTYRSRGVRVSALCPFGVRTGLLMPGVAVGHPAALAVTDAAPILEPPAVADAVVDGVAEERFLILPHAEVAVMYAAKAADPDTWIRDVAGRHQPARKRAG